MTTSCAAFALLILGCVCSALGSNVTVTISASSPLSEVASSYLSVAIDTLQLFEDPPFPYSNAKIIKLASHLTPAYLRVGGSDADHVYYGAMKATDPEAVPAPPGYSWVLTPTIFDSLIKFASESGLQLIWGLNGGGGPRRYPNGTQGTEWRADDAKVLLEYTAQKKHAVPGWELGNEPSLYSSSYKPSSEQLAKDYTLLQATLAAQKGLSPYAIMGPDDCCNVELMVGFIPLAAKIVERFTFHYYPMDVCGGKAPPPVTKFLNPENVQGIVSGWINPLSAAIKQHAAGRELWIGESSSVACQGAHNETDVYLDAFVYLNQLGLAAQKGIMNEVRQTLLGSPSGGTKESFKYNLINMVTGVPNPDYWGAVLFKTLMGTKVLNSSVNAQASVRVYAHCTPSHVPNYVQGSITLLVLNFGSDEATLLLDAASKITTVPRVEYRMTAPYVQSAQVHLNGKVLQEDAQGNLPSLDGAVVTSGVDISLQGESYAFFVLPKAVAQACM